MDILSLPVVIPALNPDEKFPLLIRTLQRDTPWLTPFIVVNDGSGPASSSIWEAVRALPNVVILEHERNRGQGRGIKTGLAYCMASIPQARGVVTADCDGQHAPDDIAAVAETFAANRECLILGAREFSAASIPWRSRFGNRLSSRVFRLAGVNVRDTQTGLRAIPAALFPVLRAIPYDRFEFNTAMLIAAVKNGTVIREHAIKTIYLDGNRSSHFRPLRDSFAIYRVVLRGILGEARRFIISSLTAAAVDLAMFSLMFHVVARQAGMTCRLIAATLAARLCSSSLNYLMNRSYVFHCHGGLHRVSLPRYAALCVLVAGGSCLCMRVLMRFAAPEYAVVLKAAVDLSLFLVSFGVQKWLVFGRRARTSG